MRLSVKHNWNVKPDEARQIQEELRTKWEGKDRFGPIRTVAGLDAAFVLQGSQAERRKQAGHVKGPLQRIGKMDRWDSNFCDVSPGRPCV